LEDERAGLEVLFEDSLEKKKEKRDGETQLEYLFTPVGGRPLWSCDSQLVWLTTPIGLASAQRKMPTSSLGKAVIELFAARYLL
jgi:hypothetical protein